MLIVITIQILVGLEPSRHFRFSYVHMNEIYILFYNTHIKCVKYHVPSSMFEKKTKI